MIALVTVLVAFPAGFFVRSWLAANVVFIAAHTWAYTFQSFHLGLDAIAGDRAAGTPDEFPWAYGLVTLGIYVAGFGLVALGRRIGASRRSRTHRPATAHQGVTS